MVLLRISYIELRQSREVMDNMGRVLKEKRRKISSLIVVMLVLTTSMIFAQADYKFQVFAGPDFNRLIPPSDTMEIHNSVTPFGGLSIIMPSGKNEMHLGTSIFMKSSRDDKRQKYQNVGIALFGEYQIRLSDNISITAGPQYSVVLNSYMKTGAISTSMSGYGSYLSLNAGLNINLQKNLSLGLNYEYPFTQKLEKWPSFKLKFTYTIDKELFKQKDYELREKVSVQEIKELKKTAILVSLYSYRNRLRALEGEEYAYRRSRIIEERNTRNIRIIEAFEKYFDFCDVYYFYNSDTKKIKDGNFEGVFVNEKLEKDTSITFNLDHFMVARIGYAERDTVFAKSHADVYKNGFNNADGYATTSIGYSDVKYYGLFVMNQNFEFVSKPFPSFIRQKLFFVKLPVSSMVGSLNKRLYNYYNSQRLE
jgi:hypothetical protein